jgi:hypothetical protein
VDSSVAVGFINVLSSIDWELFMISQKEAIGK